MKFLHFAQLDARSLMRRHCRLIIWRCPPPPVEILEEPRALQRDLDELGDSAASVLLVRAERCARSLQFDAGERYMEQALSRVQESLERPPVAPLRGGASYFDPCAQAVA
jgi:hypothetical protein